MLLPSGESSSFPLCSHPSWHPASLLPPHLAEEGQAFPASSTGAVDLPAGGTGQPHAPAEQNQSPLEATDMKGHDMAVLRALRLDHAHGRRGHCHRDRAFPTLPPFCVRLTARARVCLLAATFCVMYHFFFFCIVLNIAFFVWEEINKERKNELSVPVQKPFWGEF